MAKGVGSLDRLIGSRIRAARLQMGLSQTELGDALGITFQQVQKYEKGTNRVSASRLYKIGHLLNMDIQDFFKGADEAQTESPDGLVGLANLSKGDFQMVQAMLADSAIEINAARAALGQCAWELDAGLDPRAKISALKVQGSETLGRVVDRAMQIFGGMGFSKDLPIERYYRDCRALEIVDGTSQIQQFLIARDIYKKEGLEIRP